MGSGQRSLGRRYGDTFIGSNVEITLIGGRGTDSLTGGLAADILAFRAIGESKVGAGLDVITDFTQGGDKIGLAAFDAIAGGANDPFSFIGDSAFGNVAGQMRYEHAGGQTVVMADINGDSKADFEVGIDGQLNLVATDFLL